jgi:phosphoglycerate dehydrogenase-like enzyme
VPELHVLEYIRDPNGVWSLPAAFLDHLRSSHPSVRFSSPKDREEAERLLPEAEVVLGWAVRRSNLARAHRLRWIHVSAAGVDSLLFPEMVASEVVITNGRGLHSVAMAEHTLGVILAFVRNLHLARDAQRERAWIADTLWRGNPPLGELAGTTLGLVGLGSVGSAIAVRARPLGLRIVAARRRPSSDPAPADAQWGLDRLDELIAAADWLVLSPPLTAETRHLMDARRIALMKPSAVLINLGRGALVDEPALIAALESHRIAGAALDVFAEEPLPASSKLWAMPHVIVTPHISGLGPRYWERAMALFERNLSAFLAGRPMENVVDKRAGY